MSGVSQNGSDLGPEEKTRIAWCLRSSSLGLGHPAGSSRCGPFTLRRNKMSQRNIFRGLATLLMAMSALLATTSVTAAEETARKEIVKKILDVKLAVQESEPPALTITATGE